MLSRFLRFPTLILPLRAVASHRRSLLHRVFPIRLAPQVRLPPVARGLIAARVLIRLRALFQLRHLAIRLSLGLR